MPVNGGCNIKAVSGISAGNDEFVDTSGYVLPLLFEDMHGPTDVCIVQAIEPRFCRAKKVVDKRAT